jgi:ATP-dependent RNA helicase SUPV3L1/SUV3
LAKNQAGTLIELFPSQIKQIAGRAGRFRVAGVSSDSTEAGGVVTAMHGGDMAILRKGMQAAMEPLSHAMLWPPWKVFEQFTHQFPVGTPLATMIGHFVDISKSTPIYRPIQSDQQMILAQAIEHLPNIDPESRYSIMFAPISHKKEDEVRVFVRLAEVMSKCEPVTIKSPSLRLHLDLVDSQYKEVRPTLLRPLETLHKLITCYLWLSYISSVYCPD